MFQTEYMLDPALV